MVERGACLKTELGLLIELQRMDTEIGRIHMKRKDLPLELAKLEEGFNSFRATVQEEATRLDETGKRRQESEGKLKKAVEALRKAKERLQEVKTNKEYQAVLKEIEGMEKRNGEIEEEIIRLLDDMDTGRTSLNLKEEELASEERRFETQRQALQRQIDALDSEFSDHLARGEALRQTLPAALLKKYDTIKNINNGLAVVSVWKEVCNGCHMNIPPQMYNELHTTEDFFLCPHCNRILFLENTKTNDV